MSITRTSRTTVLVVGAGPVGLALATDLTRQGVAVRIVTAGPVGRSPHSRAIVMWPRSLELLRRIDATDALVAAGHRIDAVRFFVDKRLLASADLCALADTPYPFGLMIPQNRTEQVLAEQLAAAGGVVESGVELIGLDTSGPLPVARLRHVDGAEEDVEADWLVGADGAHSTTRSLLGVPFPAEGDEVLFAIGDAVVGGAVPPEALVYSYSAAGALGIAPLGGELFRIAFAVPRWDRPDGPEPAMFQRFLDRLSPFGGTVKHLHWSTVFRARRHTATTFRSGRCFLAGDAAHIFSAAGAQGMNTGLQDAINLGWKLGGVIRGRLDAAILDSYDTERRPEVGRVSLNTARQTTWGLLRRPAQVLVRNGLVRLAGWTGVMQRLGTPLISQTDVAYGEPVNRLERYGFRRRLRPGMRIPAFARLATDHGDEQFPALPGDDMSVLLWPGNRRDTAWRLACQEIRDAVPPDVQVVEALPGGVLHRLLGGAPALVVVRPDGHVAAVEREVRAATVRQALSRVGVLPTYVPVAVDGAVPEAVTR